MNYNILFISGWYPTRMKPTLGNFVFKHAECIARNNHIRAIHVCIDSTQKTKIEIEQTTTPFWSKVIYIRKCKIPILGSLIDKIRLFLRYNKEFKQLHQHDFQVDIIHANIVYPIGILAWWIKKKHKINYIISEHWTGYFDKNPTHLNILQRYISKKAISDATFILPVSKDLAKEMKLLFKKGNYTVIPNVIDNKIFSPIPNFTPIKTHFVHISSFDDIQKNINGIIRSIKELSDAALDFDFTFVSDGVIEPFIEYAKSLSLSPEQVKFTSQKTTEEVAEILQKSSCLVMFSNYETFSIVIAEALSCGIPIIATQVGGLGNELTEKEGITISSMDESALTEAMKRIICKTAIFNKTNLTNFASQFSYEKVNFELNKIYDTVINQ